MASGRGQSGGRREPVFDSSPEVRVNAGERSASGGAPKPRRKKGKKKKAARSGRPLIVRMAYWSLVACLWLVIGAVGTMAYVGAHLPPIQSLEIPKRPPSIQIVDYDGRPLARRGDLAGAPMSLKELPAYVPRAFVAIEDRRFYDHYGVDPLGIGRALIANILHRGVAQGGSTITQQLAKNLFLTQERTMTRKLQEVVLALWLEHKFSKDQILEIYLNRVYFGSGAYGVEAACQRYYGKSARPATLAEAAMLAGLVKSPSRLAPTRNYDAAQRRSQAVLAAMAAEGFAKEDAVQLALAQP